MHFQRKSKSVTKLFKKHAKPPPELVGAVAALFFVTHRIKTILAGNGYGMRTLTGYFLLPILEACRRGKTITFGADRLFGAIRNLFRSRSSGFAISERHSYIPIADLKKPYQQPSTCLPTSVFRNCQLRATNHRNHQDQYVRKRLLGIHCRGRPAKSVSFRGQVISIRAAIYPSPPARPGIAFLHNQ